MTMPEVVPTGALVAMGIILLVLIQQGGEARRVWEKRRTLPEGFALGADLGNGEPRAAVGVAGRV